MISTTLGVRHWFSPEYSIDFVARLQTLTDLFVCHHSSPSEVLLTDYKSRLCKWKWMWLLQESSLQVALCHLFLVMSQEL